MWNNDLPVTLNVDVQWTVDLAARSQLGESRMGFFPFPRVEKLYNSQECGGRKQPRKRLDSPVHATVENPPLPSSRFPLPLRNSLCTPWIPVFNRFPVFRLATGSSVGLHWCTFQPSPPAFAP